MIRMDRKWMGILIGKSCGIVGSKDKTVLVGILLGERHLQLDAVGVVPKLRLWVHLHVIHVIGFDGMVWRLVMLVIGTDRHKFVVVVAAVVALSMEMMMRSFYCWCCSSLSFFSGCEPAVPRIFNVDGEFVRSPGREDNRNGLFKGHSLIGRSLVRPGTAVLSVSDHVIDFGPNLDKLWVGTIWRNPTSRSPIICCGVFVLEYISCHLIP